jgi:multidrug resistance efflux pump
LVSITHVTDHQLAIWSRTVHTLVNASIGASRASFRDHPARALADVNSLRVQACFQKASIQNIRGGDRAIVTLTVHPGRLIEDRVDSLDWGIAHKDASMGCEPLPKVTLIVERIRLAQRVPTALRGTRVEISPIRPLNPTA